MLLKNVTLDHFKYEADVLGVCGACEVRVDVLCSLRINVDEHASNELSRLHVITDCPYSTHTHRET